MTPVRYILPMALLVAACHPLKAPDPSVQAGIKAFDQKDYPLAQQHFDQALADDPSPQAQLGRGAALYAQQKYPEAAEALRRAAGTDDPALQARAYFDLGNAEARAGKWDAAVEAFKRSLQRDPTDPDARYNLELALRAREEAKKQQKQKGPGGDQDKQDDEKSDDKSNPSQDPSTSQGGGQQGDQGDQKQQPSDQNGDKGDGTEKSGEAGQKDEQKPSPQAAGKSGQEQGEQQQAAQGKQGQDGKDGKPAQAVQVQPMNRQEAADVLDALQAGEKNLQMWRFQQGERKRGERNGRAQDW